MSILPSTVSGLVGFIARTAIAAIAVRYWGFVRALSSAPITAAIL